MKEWRLVVLLCTALLCEPVRPQEKWSRLETAEKRIDDWVPITATCPTCQKNLEPNESGGIDEIGSLLNPPAVPSGRAFNFNGKQNNFNRITAGEPYEPTTPPTPSAQFFGQQQQAPKIPQPVHFPLPFLGQQNPFQTRFPGVPSFQPQFTFIPQPQVQPSAPKEKKVTFPDSPFIQQQNKGSVQLVYVPIEALQRQKPRFQADRPAPQQTQLDVKNQSPFETGKLKFQRPPQPFDSPRFPISQQFEQEHNRFAPPPPPPQSSFEQDTGRFPPQSQLLEQEKPNFPAQEHRPEFLPQNEQPVGPQSYQFVEDVRNPPSTFFQFHDNRFQKPSFEESKPKESKPQVQQTFVPNFDESRQESTQNFVSNFDGNRPRQGPPQQNIQPNFSQNFQETRPKQEPQPQNVQPNFQETRPRQEPRPQNNQQNFQETRPRQEVSSPQPPPQFVPKFEEPKLGLQQQFVPNFQETRPRQEIPPPPPQFVPKFEEPKLDLQQQFIPNFQETRPRQELPPSPPQFVPKFEEPKLEAQPQFIPNFQDIPQQEPAQPEFTPNFESLRPKPDDSQESFLSNFDQVKPKPKPITTPAPQQAFNLPSSTEQFVQTPSTTYPPPHQPPLSVYMEKRLDNRINEVLTILKDAKTIPVLDTIGNRSPKVFVGPSDLDAPRGYVKFELPYLSSLDITKIDSMADRLPFFVAPLNFKPPFGYAKIPFPPPHIGSVVVSSKSPAVVTSTEFTPFTLTSQLPTEVNSLQPSVLSTTQRRTEKAQPSTDGTPTTTATKRNRQRKPLHRGSLTSFSSTTPINDISERQRDQFTTPTAELQRLPENTPIDQHQSLESTTTPVRQKFTRKPVEQQTAFETTQAPVEQQQPIFDSTPPPVKHTFSRKPVEQHTAFETTQAPVEPQQPIFESTPTPVKQKFLRKPVEQQSVFETTQAPIQQQQQQQQQFDIPSQQFFADQQVPQSQQEYLDTLPQLTQQQQQQLFNNEQQPSQQPFFENQQQFLDNSPQTIQDQISNNPQSFLDANNQDINQQQFISSSTEKQIFKNFQQIQPLSQYQVGNNNFINQQQSSTEQVQSVSNTPETVSNEPQTITTVTPIETPKLRQRLSYYDKLQSSSTQVPVETTNAQAVAESSEKPRERQKLRPRQRYTTTRKPTTESLTSDEVPEQVSETSTQRYNPLKRRRPTSTTTTTEQVETTRSSLRPRTTQAGRSEFVRSRSRRPTTTSTTTTTTTEAAHTQQYEDADSVQASGQDEQKKIEEAASFWNEPVTIQQSHGYELDTTYTQTPLFATDGKFGSAEPPAADDFSKEKHGNDKKAHDPNNEKKAPGRRGHWVRVRVKKPQDHLDTAESQNSLGPLSANSIRELVTKPTGGESDGQSSASGSSSTATEPEVTEVTPTAATTASPTTASTSTTSTTSTTTSTTTTSPTTTDIGPPPSITTVSDYAEERGVTDERPTETAVVPSSPAPSTAAKYPDDEQDEVFQRNLADMLAKFIGGDNDPQQQQQQQQQQEQQQQEQQLQQQQQETTATEAEESTGETQYADVELTVTPPAVTELPTTPVTSTTTKVSMETEICYRGRCVKSKKNKQITDMVPEP